MYSQVLYIGYVSVCVKWLAAEKTPVPIIVLRVDLKGTVTVRTTNDNIFMVNIVETLRKYSKMPTLIGTYVYLYSSSDVNHQSTD